MRFDCVPSHRPDGIRGNRHRRKLCILDAFFENGKIFNPGIQLNPQASGRYARVLCIIVLNLSLIHICSGCDGGLPVAVSTLI